MYVPAGTKCTNCDEEIRQGHYALEGKRGDPYCTKDACAAVAKVAEREQDQSDQKVLRARQQKADAAAEGKVVTK